MFDIEYRPSGSTYWMFERLKGQCTVSVWQTLKRFLTFSRDYASCAAMLTDLT